MLDEEIRMEDRKEYNIVMFPFMAQGHIIPFLALALKIEQEKGYTVTIVNTPLNINNLRPSLPPNSSIRLLEIPFNSTDHGLPPAAENTDALPPPQQLRLVQVASSLKPAFRKLISALVNENNGRPPLCIISDMFFGWSAQVAHDFGAFHAVFNAGGGFGMAVFHSVWVNMPHRKVKSDDDEFWLPGFPKDYRIRAKELPEDVRDVTAPSEFIQTISGEWSETDAMLFNTVEEVDHAGLVYFRQQFRCPVWAIGPVVSCAGRAEMRTLKLCMEWLDSKASNSVVYVAFGSQGAPSQSQTEQLAMALAATGRSFIWVVRRSEGFEFEQWIEDTNKKKVGQGLVLREWAPQMEILSHRAIGGFVSHCGWNSVLEALINGVPMISWPMGAEQPFNAKMLEEELGVCVGLGRTTECEEIVRKIEMVMDVTSEKGEDMRRKAGEVKEMIRNASSIGSSLKAMDHFLNAAILHMRNRYISTPCTNS